jgi:hypothetical protein
VQRQSHSPFSGSGVLHCTHPAALAYGPSVVTMGAIQTTAVPIPRRLMSLRRETLVVLIASISTPPPIRRNTYRISPLAIRPCRRRDRGPIPHAGMHFGVSPHVLGTQA